MIRIAYLTLSLCFCYLFATAQNSSCMQPSGPMAQPGDTVPTCFAGHTGPNFGPLTQFYTFTATTPTMTVQLTPVLGTTCSFPNTAVNYTNFQLYRTGACNALLGTSPYFTNLVPGDSYTFGLTMTPADNNCVWITEACPSVLEVSTPLNASDIHLEAKETGTAVTLTWSYAGSKTPKSFRLYRSLENQIEATMLKEVAAATQLLHSHIDYPETNAELLYYIEARFEDGSTLRSSTVSAHAQEDEKLLIYPNPVSTELRMKGMGPCGEIPCEFSIRGLDGKLQDHWVGSERVRSVSALTPGYYFLTLNDGKTIRTTKFIKE